MTEGQITLTLPCVCPEPGCGTYLQRTHIGIGGVGPHYRLMHPGRPIPVVTQ